jgi:hypothetical protein
MVIWFRYNYNQKEKKTGTSIKMMKKKLRRGYIWVVRKTKPSMEEFCLADQLPQAGAIKENCIDKTMFCRKAV